MFKKFFLLQDIVKTLVRKEFDVTISRGCFDVAAKRELLLLLKVLFNIDGMEREAAVNLKAISYFVSAYPLIISLKNNREKLKDEIIYSRFGVPVVTPKTFKKVIEEDAAYCFSIKGKHLAKVNVKKIRKRRMELNYSLSKLSYLTKISKKTLYNIEREKVIPSMETAKKLEKVLKTKLILSFELEMPEKIVLSPKRHFEKRVSKKFFEIGIENSPVYSAPFNLVGREGYSIITKLSEKPKIVKGEVDVIKDLSIMFSSLPLVVAKKVRGVTCVSGVPIFLESELSGIESSHELKKLIEERI
jgi:putative transcriptional regulator